MRKILTFALVLAFSLQLVGCAGAEQPLQIEYLIGVSMANMREPWRLVMEEELNKEAEQHPNVRLIFTDAGGDSKKQASDIQRLQGYGIDLLIISPTDVEEMTPVVEQVYQSIPVVVLNRAVEGYGYSLYIGPDNELIGKMAGEAVLEMVQPDNPLTVLELAGSANSPASQERTKGFESITGQHSNIRILQFEVEEESRDAHCLSDSG